MTLLARNLAPPNLRPLTLGLLTPHNVHDPRTFSGTAYHAARALARQSDIRLTLLGDHRPPGISDRLARRFGRARTRVSPPGPEEIAGLDAVVGLVASDLLDALPPHIPYLHVTDATPGFLADAYGWDIPAETHARERRAVQRAAVCLYSSDAMARRAGRELGALQARALPFGVNFSHDHGLPRPKPPLDPVELLFVGTDWDRKGGDIALGALRQLRRRGVPAHLTLVGQCPASAARHQDVTATGFLDKSKPHEARKLARLFARAHLLVLPTRGDCTPMVIAEAMAHGTPVLATDTGGIAEMIDGGAGRCLPMTATPVDWAGAITAMTHDRDAFAIMSDAARDRARNRYSWDIWANGIARIAREHLVGCAHAA